MENYLDIIVENILDEVFFAGPEFKKVLAATKAAGAVGKQTIKAASTIVNKGKTVSLPIKK